MTDLLTRPALGDAGSLPPRRSVLLAAATAAAWAAALGLATVTVVVMVTWATSSSTVPASAALRTAGAWWLLAQHTGLRLDGGTLGLVPLGLTLLPAALLYRAGRSLARHVEVRGARAVWTAATALAAAYALACAVVAGAVRGPGLQPHPVQALAGGWVLALACAGTAIARYDGLPARAARRLPGWARAGLAGAGVAAAGLAAAAALAVGGALVAGHAEVAQLTSVLRAGPVGGATLVLLQAAFLPDALAWAAAYLVGPGFSIGAGTAYSAYGYAGGSAPALPMLAALPPGPAPGWVRVATLATVLAAGALGGLAVRRRLGIGRPWWHLAGLAAAAGVTAAGLVAVAVVLAAGPAGPGAMATVGASAWRVGLLAAAELGGAAAVAVAAAELAPPGWRRLARGGVGLRR